MYSKKVLEHFSYPRNMGEIKDADGVGEVGNIKCGDVMKMYIKVGQRTMAKGQKTEEYIEDIKFQTLGCAAAIATSSITTELAKGKTLKEAVNISKDDINNALGKLPAIKYHCSILADKAIKEAIANYQSKKSGK
jgi:nitrogen fixation protein NifU and related proteins